MRVPNNRPGYYTAYTEEDATAMAEELGAAGLYVDTWFDRMRLVWRLQAIGDEPEPTHPNCVNCGAPVNTNRCDYCGTHH